MFIQVLFYILEELVVARKNKVKRYSRIYRGHGKNKSWLFHVLICLGLFVIIALVVYLIATGVNSYLNRDRHVEIEYSQASEADSSVKDDVVDDMTQQNETLVASEIPANKLTDGKYLSEFITKAKNDNKNAIIIPLKNENGNLLYASKITEAEKWGTISKTVADAKKIASEIQAAGLIPIARVSAFYDQLAPHVKRNNSYGYVSRNNTTYLFKNSATGKSEKWLNPYQSVARKYICDIVKEISEMGYKHVLLDNASFPGIDFNAQVKTDDEGKSKSDILKQFFKELDSTGVSYILSYNWKILGEKNLANTLYGGNVFEYGIKKQALLINLANKPFSGDNKEVVKKSIETIKNFDSNVLIFPTILNSDSGNNVLDLFKANGIYSIFNLNK